MMSPQIRCFNFSKDEIVDHSVFSDLGVNLRSLNEDTK